MSSVVSGIFSGVVGVYDVSVAVSGVSCSGSEIKSPPISAAGSLVFSITGVAVVCIRAMAAAISAAVTGGAGSAPSTV